MTNEEDLKTADEAINLAHELMEIIENKTVKVSVPALSIIIAEICVSGNLENQTQEEMLTEVLDYFKKVCPKWMSKLKNM